MLVYSIIETSGDSATFFNRKSYHQFCIWMPLPLWRTQCSKFLCSGHRHYALATIFRRAYAHAVFAELSPDNYQQSEKIAAPPTSKKGKLGRQAKEKSAGLKERITSRRNLLEHTKVQEYLDFVASANNTVTLADIERCRPPFHGAPGTPKYETDYNSLLETLVRSFSTKQLRQFLHLYQLDPPRKRTKWHYAASIIERQWGWPSLTEIQKQQRDWTEVLYKCRSFSRARDLQGIYADILLPSVSSRSSTGLSHPWKRFVL